jgi:heat shock protein HslJ
MSYQKIIYPAAVLAVILSLGIGVFAQAARLDAEPTLENSVWLWQSLMLPRGVSAVDKPENYRLEFMPEGRLRIKADCNRGSGTYGATGEDLSVSSILTTKMACPPGSLGSSFTGNLQNAEKYLLTDGDLHIGLPDGGVMRFSRLDTDSSELPGTVWNWTGLETGGEDFPVGQSERYRIEFRTDGRLAVTADCNRGSGTYQAENGGLSISEIALTRAFCGEDSLDTRFAGELSKAAGYRFEDGRLLIETAAGLMKFSKAGRYSVN